MVKEMSIIERKIMLEIKKDLRRTRMKMYTQTKDAKLRMDLFRLLVKVNQEINELQAVA